MSADSKRHSSSVSRDPMPMVCSTCGKDFLLDETEAPPFCSQRCRMIDLGRWLDEEIGVPHEGGPDGGHREPHDDREEHDDNQDE